MPFDEQVLDREQPARAYQPRTPTPSPGPVLEARGRVVTVTDTRAADSAGAPYPAHPTYDAAPRPTAPPAGGGLDGKKPMSVLLTLALAVGGWYLYGHRKPPNQSQPISQSQPAPTSPSTTSGGTATGSGSQPATNPAATGATAELMTHVPADIRRSCEPHQIQGASAAVFCSTEGHGEVAYAQYTSATVDDAFASSSQGMNFAPANGCFNSPCRYSGNGGESGSEAWFTKQTSHGPAVGVLWSSRNTGILAIAMQPGTDNRGLSQWWHSDSGPV